MLSYAEVSKIDKRDVLGILSSLPEQIVFGLDQATHYQVTSDVKRIFIMGMGGSAIAGDVFASWTMDRRATGIEVVRDYRLPAYASDEDVVIAVSYSGNTEETLSAASQALRIGCRLIGVGSGGDLVKFCEENRSNLVMIPKGYPPRGAFGYLFGAILGLCRNTIIDDPAEELEKALHRLEGFRKTLMPDKGAMTNRAKAIAVKVRGKTPIIYGSMAYTPIARRWQTQFNENAKILAWSSCLPEANHNEVEGWGGDRSSKHFLPILLRDSEETDELKRRLTATKTIMNKNVKPLEVKCSGEGLLGRMLCTLLLGDLASVYLAVLRKTDPHPVSTIEKLKKEIKSKHLVGQRR